MAEAEARAQARHRGLQPPGRTDASPQARAGPLEAEAVPMSTAVVLAEDKKYYPGADEARAGRHARAPAASLCARCTARARRRW